MIGEQEGWTSAKVGTLGEHLAGRALTLITVTQGPRTWAQRLSRSWALPT
jgi:hypothetical protein